MNVIYGDPGLSLASYSDLYSYHVIELLEEMNETSEDELQNLLDII